jgi:phage terminase large subunit-like protein
MARRKQSVVDAERQERRLLAENSLEEFIKLIHPNRMLGSIHKEIIQWWTSKGAKKHQLLLLPRDHMKSALIAYRAAWELTRDPTLRILYISSTSNLAVKQLNFIKGILTHDRYRQHWPEMVNLEEAKREKWTEKEISVDHPKRKEEHIRDPSIFTAGLTTNIVGMHCDIAVLDDCVVQSNAYTEEGREKVRDQYSYLSSIETINAREWTVGTRYHPKDLYSSLLEMEVDHFDEFGNKINSEPLYDHKQWAVESYGDGTGEFIWPRSQRSDGKWFGFDAKVLAEKRAQYLNKTQFRAQYYNDPHDIDSSPISSSLFQYYNKDLLNQRNGTWFYGRERLNIAASIDFAYSLSKKADSTAIVVVGADSNNNYYVLDIDRFKTGSPSEYFKHILKLYEFWGFNKIRAEVTAAQEVIVKDLKENYIRKNGLSLSVEEFRPSRWQGSKEERILATLEPKYANRQIWHYRHGNCQLLEEELIYTNPAHDDIKDALSSAIDLVVKPQNRFTHKVVQEHAFQFHGRFGGTT